jgi:DNA-binding NtrC family response regulator
MPLRLQPKLLRAVENLEIQPVGSARSHKVNVRLVSATNRDPEAMVSRGEFRADLYYRLAASSIEVPPLRDRRDALPTLVGHLIRERGQMLGRKIDFISSPAMSFLSRYDWPGNVRQLVHAIESTIITAAGNRIDVGDLPKFVHAFAASSIKPHLLEPLSQVNPPGVPIDRGHTLSLDQLTRQAVLHALQICKGNRKRAAERLGISRPRLYRMIASFGLEKVNDLNILAHLPSPLPHDYAA